MKYPFMMAMICVFCPKLSCIAQPTVLNADRYQNYVDRFRANDLEMVVNRIPNSQAWDWMVQNVPFLDCPSTTLEEIYYFRWWTLRKHIKETPEGQVFTEFLRPVSHAGKYNTVSCAVGHHLSESRWLRDKTVADDYIRFWFCSGGQGEPAPHLHKFSSWIPYAVYDRYRVTGDPQICIEFLDAMIKDDQAWVAERQLDDGLFWQHDVKDGMEESISGGRRAQNARPTINSYMAANALAISNMAELADRRELVDTYRAKFANRVSLLRSQLWDSDASFFKVRLEDGSFSDAREAIGYIPWAFHLAEPKHIEAWKQLQDSNGFLAPKGITTAERRHPKFRTHGTGTCEWDGAVWPFATSQTLNGLANVLRGPEQMVVSRKDFLDHMLTYARSHQWNGVPYLGEYHDEITGDWLITGAKAERSRYYNHSTFNDLVIYGLVGVVPRADQMIEIDPLLPSETWPWFCLDGVPYHGHNLTVLWDKTGERYRRGTGFMLLVDGKEVKRLPSPQRITVDL